ncbi:MAG: ABC transporter ATP-binding protein [Firmicutes bacterium]|nr:ABC transporter ATP-binding protein [Bacillota bacterium]
MLQVMNLDAAYGQAQVLKGLSFEVKAGEIVTLIGPNGAGKTTILSSIMGFIRNIRGKILFEGKDIAGLETEAIVNLGVGMAPETRGLFPPLTVMENLMLGAYLRLQKGPSKSVKAAIKADLDLVFSLFPILESRLRQPVGTLSGGQQQMAAISRALMSRPKLLLLDEPSLGLAPLVIREIFKVIETLNKSGMSILLIEQNANLALKTAHRGYVIENGRICLEGGAAELRNHDQIKQAYLGRNYA